MVDLPKVPRRIVTTEAPRSSLTREDISAPYTALARGLHEGGDALSDVAVAHAEDAGQQAVTRDAEGNLRVDRMPVVGRAAKDYERGVRFAAVTDAENVIRRDSTDLRQQFPNDPAGYVSAMGEYKNKKIAQYTQAGGEHVGRAVGQLIEREATQGYRGLAAEKERRDLAHVQQSVLTEIETARNEMFALAAGGDTSSPDYQERVEKLHRLYGELVNNPRIAYPRARADADLARTDSELRAHAVVHNIGQVYDREGPEAAMRAAEAIRTDPGLSLTPQQREASYSRAIAAVNQRARAGQLVVNSASQEIQAIDRIAAGGDQPTPTRMASLRRAVTEANDPALTEQFEAMEASLPTLAAWRQMSPAQLEQEIGALDRRMREQGADERSIALRRTGQELLRNMRSEIQSDPLRWADRAGVVQVPTLDFGSEHAVADMRQRAVIADVVARQYGIRPVYLTPEERRTLEVAGGAGGQQMQQVAQMIVNGFGPRAPQVLGEISQQAPVLAHMGGLLSGALFGGGSPVFANDVAEAVRLQQDREFKPPRWLDVPSDTIRQAQTKRAVDVYGGAFTMVPDTGRAAVASAEKAFFTRAVRHGFEPKLEQSNSRAAFDRALQEGAGAVYMPDGTRYGGVNSTTRGSFPFRSTHHVLVPSTIRADRFPDVIGAIRDDDLSRLPVSPQASDGKAYTARDIAGAAPVAVPGGYRFAMGDPGSDDPKWIRGADGRPFVLDLEAMSPVLRTRVPAAFRGGN